MLFDDDFLQDLESDLDLLASGLSCVSYRCHTTQEEIAQADVAKEGALKLDAQ
jgi:hypothetical protein